MGDWLDWKRDTNMKERKDFLFTFSLLLITFLLQTMKSRTAMNCAALETWTQLNRILNYLIQPVQYSGTLLSNLVTMVQTQQEKGFYYELNRKSSLFHINPTKRLILFHHKNCQLDCTLHFYKKPNEVIPFDLNHKKKKLKILAKFKFLTKSPTWTN